MSIRKKIFITSLVIIIIIISLFIIFILSSTIVVDTTTKATVTVNNPTKYNNEVESKMLIILVSSSNNSTAKIAEVFADVLDAQIKSPEQVIPEDIQNYNLIGFGSGIFSQQHHKSLLDLVDKLPQVVDKKVYIFSTSGISRKIAINNKINDPHTPLREKLKSKGFVIADEFNCVGLNTNSFLKLFGGMNKGRPNEKDLKQAEEICN